MVLFAARGDAPSRTVFRPAGSGSDLNAIIANGRRSPALRPPAPEGFCVASGGRAGCKRVVGNRLKRAGMRWTLAGANAVIALRCSRLGGRFEDFRDPESRRLSRSSQI